MMEETLVQLAQDARRERAVAIRKMDNGMQLLVYPLDDDVLVALGYERDLGHLVNTETVLRRRAESPSRYGPWLPAMFSDGSWYVVRRVAHGSAPADVSILPEDELLAAQELLT